MDCEAIDQLKMSGLLNKLASEDEDELDGCDFNLCRHRLPRKPGTAFIRTNGGMRSDNGVDATQ